MASVTKKKDWRFERVRLHRRNGWIRAAIARETGARCYVVLCEKEAFGTLQKAREFGKPRNG